MNSRKTQGLRQEGSWNSPNPLVKEFRTRILTYLGEGLNKVWFQLEGDSQFELAGALGILAKDYQNILLYGGFASSDCKFLVSKLQNMLAIEI